MVHYACLPLSPIENKSLFVMSDMLLEAEVTAACNKQQSALKKSTLILHWSIIKTQ